MKRKSLFSVALLLVIVACNSNMPAATPMPIQFSPTAAVIPSTHEGSAGSVEFVWSMTGEPNRFDAPSGLATDIQGNLYVLDAGNHRIQVFDANGRFVTMWGKQGSAPGEFNFLRADGNKIGAVVLDSYENIYVADNANQRMQKFDNRGVFLMEWGSHGTGDGQFLSPVGVAVDLQGNIYVIDDGRDDIQKFDCTGRFLLKWGSHGAGDGQFNDTGRLTVDQEGNLYVADFANHRIQKFDGQGRLLAKWGAPGKEPGQFNNPADIVVDSQGNIYIVEYAAHPPETYRVQVFDSEGNFIETWGYPGKGDGEFIHPLAISVDSQGNVYVGDETNRVQKFRKE
jgi:DNA-binding beta-propeller fold protein YncE